MSLYLDTNIFLNVIYKEPKFESKSAELLRKIQAGELTAVTSAITLLEIMLDMATTAFAQQTEIALATLEDLRALTIVSLDGTMSKMAAKCVLEDKLTIHDAYHLATSLSVRTSYFVTRDARLAKKIGKYIIIVEPEEVLSS